MRIGIHFHSLFVELGLSSINFEERFYAIAALIRILGDYERYPWLHDDGKPVNLARQVHKERDDEPGVEYYHTR